MIKDAIKEELLKLIVLERKLLTVRMNLNEFVGDDNYDVNCELRFLNKLEDFANSI